jgi:hypothetical protein
MPLDRAMAGEKMLDTIITQCCRDVKEQTHEVDRELAKLSHTQVYAPITRYW